MRRLWAIKAVGALVLAVVSSVAFAQDCDSLVYDEPGLLSGSYPKIEAAAAKLASLDTDVRVRIIQDYGDFEDPDEGFTAAQDAMERECPSWQATDGGIRNNLVVFWLELAHRQSTLYAGGQWDHIANQHDARIGTDIMAPKFGDGRFDDGLAAGLNEFARLIEREANPSASGAGQTTIVNEAPTDLRGLGVALIVLAVVGGGIVTAVFFIKRSRERKREHDELQTAQQRAKAARTTCAKAMADLREEMGLHEPLIGALASLCSEADITPLRNSLTALQEDHRTLVEEFGNSKNSGNDPDAVTNRTGYTRIASLFEELGRRFARIQSRSNALAEDISELKRRAKQAAQTVQTADEKKLTASAAIGVIREQGFRVQNSESLFHEGEALLNAAREALTAKSITDVETQCTSATQKFADAITWAQALPVVRDWRIADLARLREAARIAETNIPRAATVFDNISANYAESSWTTIRGNGTEAENRLERVSRDLAIAEAAVNMDQQDWQKAEDALQRANTLLQEIDSLLRSIFELEKNLEAAKRGAAAEIDAAQADIEAAGQYIATHDDDIAEEREAELSQAASVLVQAREELANAQPDYLLVVKLARQANAASDQVLDRAQDEHQTAERKRQRAVSSLRDAQAAVSRAQEYFQDHNRDVGDDARRELQAAQQAFAQIQDTTSLDGRIERAMRAESHADTALERAKSDVRDAENARERARARRRAEEAAAREAREEDDDDTPISLPWGTSSGSIFSGSGSSGGSRSSSSRSSGSSSSFGSSSRGGGSGNSFGGFSRGGGGSSSFGSSSRGGGRSSGW